MDKFLVIETVNKLFIAVDERDWNEVAHIFDEKVVLDYTSMSGGEPVALFPQQIIDSWKGILPGFEKTHHQLGNYLVEVEAYIIKVFCYGTATHYLKNDSGNNVWTVVGTYNIELQNKNSGLRISQMKFNLKYIDGNSDLPAMAIERAKE